MTSNQTNDIYRQKPRKFLVDVTVSMPRGEGAEDWSYVGHGFYDLTENDGGVGLIMLSSDISRKIHDYLTHNPDAHNCWDNVLEDQEGYLCGVCHTDMTTKVEKRLQLSKERMTNGRATAIVDL